ncbi:MULTISPECIES: LamG domain-containing protein [unclassified Okeania]|uniref:LamG domain-containing protein n=1 Tax=unclassified Okeania TaxID=2634635 RepID=UPI0013B62DAC|nr:MULTISPECIES: LamG domain-containing protein [unclassified Okeania]NES76333.1 LamG domain-containing protein [Okeania sp. SIO1H4]NET13019.1 LamG domain-containing protein [Okeania sp. SIO1H6]NET19779.1 LamG domain-containing protein [Okeania sp. SIO1H5]NET94118.1 LamG domain-containing protein [Okeania sp. SIO1H2]
MSIVPTPASKYEFQEIRTIVHQGNTLLIGEVSVKNGRANNDVSKKLVYSVYDESANTENNDTLFRDLEFPTMVRGNGLQLIALDDESVDVDTKQPGNWVVISDDTYLYIFRAIAKINDTTGSTLLYANRYLLVPTPDETEGGKIDYLLIPKTESRYQISRLKDTPDNDLDKPSYKDLDGEFFQEPLMFFSEINPHKGWFTVILTPSDQGSTRRWLFFTGNSDDQIQAYSFLRNTDGWPDLRTKDYALPLFSLRERVSPTDAKKVKLMGRQPASLYFRRQEESDDPSKPNITSPRVMLSNKAQVDEDDTETLVAIDFSLADNGLPIIPTVEEDGELYLEIKAIKEANTALHFDGNAYVDIPFHKTTDEEFTFECWVKNEGASGSGTIISRAVGTGEDELQKSGFDLSWDVEKNLLEATFSLRETKNQDIETYKFTISTPSPSLSQWHYIAVRYKFGRYDNHADTASMSASFVIDGKNRGEQEYIHPHSISSPNIDARGAINLGQKVGEQETNWVGSLDEIRFWDVKRNDDDIVNNMYQELSDPTSKETLIGYWKFDDAFSDKPSIAVDSSQSKVDGIVYGARWTTKTAPVDPPEGPDVIPQFKGLSTGMGLLDFTKGDTFTHPTLLSGADGLVHLYMGVTRGEQSILGALQYDTAVSRAKYSLNWTAVDHEEITGTVQLFAHETGPNLNQPSLDPNAPKPVVSVTAVVGNEELVDVTFEAPAPLTDSEEFTAVPRALPEFAQVINGLASDDPLNPDVQRGNIPYYDYSGTRQAIEIPTREGLPILLVVARDAEFPSALQLTKATVGEDEDGTNLSVEMKPVSSEGIDRSFTPLLTIKPLNPNAPSFVRDLMGAGSAIIELSGAKLVKLPTITGQLYFVYAPEIETFTVTVEFSTGDLTTCSVEIEITWRDRTNTEQLQNVPTAPAQFVNHLNTEAPTTGEDIRRHFVVVAANTGERIGQGELVEETPALAPFFNIVGHSVAGNVMAGIYQTSPKQELTRHLSIDNNNSTASVFFQVMPYDPPEDGRPIHIMPMNGIQTQAGNFGGWVPTPPTTMGDFTKNQAIIPWGDTPNQEVLQIPGDFTYESWIRQTELSEKQRLLNVNAPATDTQYTVGFGVEEKALALSIPQNSPEASGKGELGAHDRVTLTCWWQPFPMGSQDRVNSSIVTLFSLRQRESSDTLSITLGFQIFAVDGENKLFWVIFQEIINGPNSGDIIKDVRLTPGWYFISLEIDLKNSNPLKISWRHKDDPEFSSKSINIASLESNFTIIEQLTIGWIGKSMPFTNIKQSISNLALWSEFLTDDQLNSLYWSNPITATIPNAYLFGYWTPSNLTDTKLPNLAPNGKELTINLSSEITIEPWEKPWQPFFFCGAGSSFAKTDTTPDVLESMQNNWTHVAAVCSNNQAVQFGDKKAAVVNDSEDFEFEQVLSIDGRFIADDLEGNAKYLVAKGDNDAQNYSYALAIVNGKLTFAGWLIDNDGDKNGFGFSLQTQIEVGKPYYFGLSFQLISNNETGEVTFTQSYPDAPAGTPNTATVESSSRTTTNKLLVHLALARLDRNVVGDIEIQQFNDNLPDNKTFKILPTTNPITIGSNAAEPSPQNPNAPLQYFVGKIADLRMWSRDISSDFVQPSQYTTPPAALQEGLEAHWRCNEGQGTTLKDSVGEHDATLDSVTMWTTSRLSTEFAIYLNGKEVATQPILANQVQDNNYGTRQFAIGFVGSYPDPAKSWPTEIFQGQMDELRLWNVPRSADEINDNMHLELSGNEDNLMGYWPISVGSGNIISDRSGYGNYATLINSNLTLFWWQPGEGEYSSPIGNEAPQIKNLLHGPTTRAQQGLATTSISASEYGALYVDADGITRGVLRRLYAYINSATKALSILPGFKVGDASLTFIGQAQSNPTLIGYIEGPPPVPGENLTRPYYRSIPRYQAYMGIASVTLTEDEDVSYSYSAQKDTGFDSSFGFNVGFVGKKELKNVTAPLGLGVEQEALEVTNKAGLSTNFSYSLGFLESAQTSIGTKYSLTSYIEVGGNWEPMPKDSKLERHYLMDNLGYALVKSGVANVYALRLERTNTLIGIQMAPDPRIAEDFNIILFPINPLYTKQGTLDGMQGFNTDDDYPEANIQRGSYFKPYAAQDLEQQIEAHEASIEADYQAFDAGKKGRRQDTTHFTEGDPVDPESTIQSETDAEYDWENNRSKRNLVNTYVWTAGGGLFAEQEQTMASRQESHSGSYSFQGMAGISANLTGAFFGFGVYMEANALLGGHIQTNVTKQKAEGRDFGLAIKNDTEAFLAKWLPKESEPENNGAAEPGKVDAYRFKSFYLAPDRDHFNEFFETVIDPNWLLTSDSNDAFALRQARASANHVWRVLHRVTYVSRVPPAFNQTPDDTAVQKKRSVIDAPQNALLIQLVNDVLTALEKTEPYSPEDIGNAVTEVLVGNYNYALVHHIPWWGDFLSNAAKDLNSIEAKDLARIKITVLSYMKAYFST